MTKSPRRPAVILGAGFTGLAAGISSGARVVEALPHAGGICRSYYVRPGNCLPLASRPQDGEVYRFEVGGGHWIFGGDPAVVSFLRGFGQLRGCSRRSAVHFTQRGVTVPYPLQQHLDPLGCGIARKARNEMAAAPATGARTLAEWLERRFGPTLTELFFAPFHERYTAGLYTEVAPQDEGKTPDGRPHSPSGASAGYNARFVYPVHGFDVLADRMAARCDVRFGARAVAVDLDSRTIRFADGTEMAYARLYSTLPLTHVLDLAGVRILPPSDPYTSVLIVNIGATAGPSCPEEHWLYIPDSLSRFHRVGIYSNVDQGFLPAPSRSRDGRVALYVERAYRGGERPADEAIAAYAREVTDELSRLAWIEDVESVHATWIEVAYTWSWPGSRWREQALEILAARGLRQLGRYGRWRFQGIAASIREGLDAGAS